MFNVLILARLQFALTIMFHYLFPPITIGLAAIMTAMEGLFLKTRNPIYENMARFWTKIFAVKMRMPVGTKTPAYWILPAQVVRTAQYGCNCRGMGGAGFTAYGRGRNGFRGFLGQVAGAV